MTEGGAGPAGEDRSRLATSRGWAGVGKGVHAAVQRVQATGADAPVDGVPAEPKLEKLGTRGDTVLATGQMRDRPLATSPDNCYLGTRPSPTLSLTVYMTVNPDLDRRAPSR